MGDKESLHSYSFIQEREYLRLPSGCWRRWNICTPSCVCLVSLAGYSTLQLQLFTRHRVKNTAVEYRVSVLASSAYTFSSFVSYTAHAGAAMRSLNDSPFANIIITGLRIIEWRRLIHCLAHNRQSNSYNVPCQLLENALPTSFASYSPHSVETLYWTVHVSDRDRYR